MKVLLAGGRRHAAQLRVDVVEGLDELSGLRQVAARHERAGHEVQLRLDEPEDRLQCGTHKARADWTNLLPEILLESNFNCNFEEKTTYESADQTDALLYGVAMHFGSGHFDFLYEFESTESVSHDKSVSNQGIQVLYMYSTVQYTRNTGIGGQYTQDNARNWWKQISVKSSATHSAGQNDSQLS